jgi:hypothetical protein
MDFHSQDVFNSFQQQLDPHSNRRSGDSNSEDNTADSKMPARQNPYGASNALNGSNIMEPTPIARQRIQVVDQLPLSSSAMYLVSGEQHQDLCDWIQLLCGNRLTATTTTGGGSPKPAPLSSMPMGSMLTQSFSPPFQHSGSIQSLPPVYESPIHLLQHPRKHTLDFERAKSVRLMEDSNHSTSTTQDLEIRPHQNEKWHERYLELCNFHLRFGHSVVPYHYKESSALAWWVKRQRHQYKMKKEGLHSTLTDERERLLEALDFVWDSHTAIWETRFQELRDYKDNNGHTSISPNDNPKLLVWVKCQRRQYKLYAAGQKSSMTPGRISKLNEIGFCWNPRRGAGAANTR